jgi:hypothetical protein
MFVSTYPLSSPHLLQGPMDAQGSGVSATERWVAGTSPAKTDRGVLDHGERAKVRAPRPQYRFAFRRFAIKVTRCPWKRRR